MRELCLKLLVLLTGVLVLSLSYAIATVRNPVMAGQASNAGQLIYQREGCARCHGIPGTGSDLDNAVSRLTTQEIRQWITAAPEVAGKLPRQALRAKRAYARLPASDIDTLVAYLQKKD